jgi:iron complex outermembrane receptor protein
MNFKRLLQLFMLPLVCLALPAFAQDRTVTGKVTDAKDGSALAGASVVVTGTGRGTTTRADGTFSLSVPAAARSLTVSSLGYEQREISLGEGALVVTLNRSDGTLNDVVVIGYGTVRKKELTGAIATVGTKDFQKGAITTPEQLIAGKVAGVSITSNSGAPGAGSTIRIRGGASLNASNDPLIVVDGVPFTTPQKGDGTYGLSGAANPLSLINPNDIESINLLKDAASTAIYGSRASNGVIMITTKKGKSGKPVYSFNTQVSLAQPTRKVSVLSADELRKYVLASGDSAHIALLGNANTNWQDLIYRTALSTDNNLSVSGSFKKMPYRLSVGYLNQDGILRTDNLQRMSAALSLSPRLLNNHLKIDLNLKGSVSKTRFGNQDAIGAAAAFDPTQAVHQSGSPFGGYFEWYSKDTNGLVTLNPNATRNPVALLEQKTDKGEVDRSFGNVQLDYSFHFLPELHANLNLGYDIAKGHGTTFIPADAAQSYTTAGANNRYLQRVNNRVGEFYLNYNKDLRAIKSNINATAGYGYYDNLTTNYFYYSFKANGDTVSGSKPAYPVDEPRNTLISYYARLIYTFNSKYILAASIRSDGSSKFAPDYRWGTFPSVAFTWRINQESFLKNAHTLTDLKLRLSYGVTGNQDGIGNYGYIPSYTLSSSSSQYQLGNSYYYMTTPSAYVSDLRWEQTQSSNIGLDYGFWNNRITGSIDAYYKKTKDLLGPVTLPVGSNFTNIVTANVGNVTNKGIEFSINATVVRNQALTWDLGFNLAYNNIKITNLTLFKDTSFIGFTTGSISGATGQTIQMHSVGYSPNAFYVYKQVYDKTGKPIEGVYADLNGDGTINSNDMYHYKSPFPKVVMGFSTQVSYKKWSLSTVLRANLGNYMYNNVAANFGVQKNILNPASYLSNASTDFYRTQFVNNQYQSDYYIQNASFLRMDNLGLGYNVGRVWNNKVNLRLSANCQNVFTITKYKGVDPEIYGGIDNRFYPRPRTYVLGLGIDF